MIPPPPGSPQPFWQRDIIFFSNLLSLFFGNEAQTRALAEEVGEIDSYGGRLLPVLDLLFRGPPGRNPKNILVLEHAPDVTLAAYLRDGLGLSLPQIEVLNHQDYLALDSTPAFMDGSQEWVDGYVTDGKLGSIAEKAGLKTLSTFTGSHDGNNKLLLHRFLESQDLPVVRAEEISAPADLPAAATRLRNDGFAAGVLKAQIGASGIGMVKIPCLGELPEIADSYFFEGSCYLQGWLAPGQGTGKKRITEIRSPSVQMFLGETPEEIVLFDITEQILCDSSVHQGNISPAPYLAGEPGVRQELLRQAAVGARWLYDRGYRGTASADFLLASHPGGIPPTAYLCEINARVTGATYPSVLARHLLDGQGAWLLRNLRLTEPSSGSAVLADLAATGHLFRRGDPSGILPINLNADPGGNIRKGQFLCLAPSPGECHDLLELAASKLPTRWTPDRD